MSDEQAAIWKLQRAIQHVVDVRSQFGLLVSAATFVTLARAQNAVVRDMMERSVVA